MRTAVRTGARTVSAGAFAAALSFGLGSPSTPALDPPHVVYGVGGLTGAPSNDQFTVSGTVGGLLYPGVTRSVSLSVTNPLPEPLTITALGATAGDPNPSCTAAANFVVGTWSGSPFTVAANTTQSNVATISLTMRDLPAAQDACATAGANTVPLTYSGQGTADNVTTTTSLISSANPSGTGQAVTFTATVHPALSLPAAPTGTVTFKDGTQVLGAQPLSPTTGTAALTTSALAAGPHAITASYGGDTFYVSSSSNPLSQQVNQQIGSCTGNTAGTVITGTVTGNYTVPAGTTVWLNGGTITGNVTVGSTGAFTATGGRVGGSVQSSGGALSIQGTGVGGAVQATGAVLGIGAGTAVSGNVQITGGTAGCLIGSSASHLQVGGNLQIQQVTGGGSVTVCGAAISGNTQVTGNGVPVVMGGSAGCPGNTVGGNLQVQTNSGRVTIGGSGSSQGNAVQNQLQVSGNTGGGTLTGNAAAKNCQLSGDTPGIAGSGNTAGNQNTCNRTA